MLQIQGGTILSRCSRSYFMLSGLGVEAGWGAAMTSPIRIDRETDERITHAARLLGVSKKALVAEAVRLYVDQQAPELTDRMRRVAELLTPASIVVSPSTLGEMADLIDEAPDPTRRLRELRDA